MPGAPSSGAAKTDKELLLVGVEAEPTHFEWMNEHFADNGLDARRHRLIQAAVAANDGVANFAIGHAEAWYGQAIVSGTGDQFNNWPEASVKEVATVSRDRAKGYPPWLT